MVLALWEEPSQKLFLKMTARLKSFSIGFKEPGFDESGYAHRVAKKIGTEKTYEILTSLKVNNPSQLTVSQAKEAIEKFSKEAFKK